MERRSVSNPPLLRHHLKETYAVVYHGKRFGERLGEEGSRVHERRRQQEANRQPLESLAQPKEYARSQRMTKRRKKKPVWPTLTF